MKIYILSPHIDDAAFGLALTIAKCAKNNVQVTIINCFTISKWTAIPVENKEVAAVSLLRKTEDAAFYKSLDERISIINLDLLDAPLRNGYVIQHKPFEPNELELVDQLKGHLEHYLDGLLLCPLGIGNHIDHAICRAAVQRLYNQTRVLFYEDLPYAQRITHQEIEEHIQQLATELGVNFTHRTDGFLDCTVDKEQAVRMYKSQMEDSIANEIMSHLNALKGERIWGEEKYLEELKKALTLQLDSVN